MAALDRCKPHRFGWQAFKTGNRLKEEEKHILEFAKSSGSDKYGKEPGIAAGDDPVFG